MNDQAERLYERLLVLRCQTGDEGAYRELVERYDRRGLGMLAIFIDGSFVFPLLAKMLQAAEQGGLSHPDTPLLLPAKLTAMCIVVGSLSFALLTAAGLATVLLVFHPRRATLYQINANLLAISEQLKTLYLRENIG